MTRFTIDIFIALSFVLASVLAVHSSPHLLICYATILIFDAVWVIATETEYSGLLPRMRFVLMAHLFPAAVFVAAWAERVRRLMVGIPVRTFDSMLPWVLIPMFVMWSVVISAYVAVILPELNTVEEGLLPIVPLGRTTVRRTILMAKSTSRIWYVQKMPPGQRKPHQAERHKERGEQ